jgi:putative membrane protein
MPVKASIQKIVGRAHESAGETAQKCTISEGAQMRKFLTRWMIGAISIFVVAHILPGIEVPPVTVVLVVALVLGIVNAFVRPLIILIALPIIILTLGLFTLFINGALFYFVSRMVKGFVIHGFWSAFFGYILISMVSFALNYLAGSVATGKE